MIFTKPTSNRQVETMDMRYQEIMAKVDSTVQHLSTTYRISVVMVAKFHSALGSTTQLQFKMFALTYGTHIKHVGVITGGSLYTGTTVFRISPFHKINQLP